MRVNMIDNNRCVVLPDWLHEEYRVSMSFRILFLMKNLNENYLFKRTTFVLFGSKNSS